MIHVLDKLVLYFIFTLGVIAVLVWTVSLIQLSQLVHQTNILQEEHNMGALDARDNVLKSKEASTLNVNMTKTNSKNIENILNNITEINKKLGFK